ncbi:hypothetical protein OC610_28300, partial [Pseudomonas sp. SAICEU22]
MLPFDNEPGLEPLAEARSRDDIFAALVAPEKRKAQRFSSVETGAQFFQVFRVVQCVTPLIEDRRYSDCAD